MAIFLNTTDLNNPTIEITQTYEVGVVVIPNPSKEPEKHTWVEYTVEAKSEFEAREKAADLCGEEFSQLPYTTEII
jgi:hypothetical protein